MANNLGGIDTIIGTGLDFALNNALAEMAANRQLKNSKKMFDYTFDAQNQRQDFLNFNAATIQKQSLKNAGLSASNLNGAPFSSNVATGGSISGSDAFAQMSLASNILQARQLDIQDKLANADIKVKEAEANKIETEIPWIDKINNATIKVQNSIAELNLGTNKRENEMLKANLDKVIAETDFINSQKSYQELVNSANEKMYYYNGNWLKGSEIPNFEILVNLDIAQKTLKVAQQNADTNRLALDNDWKAVLTRNYLVPFINWLNPILKEYGPKLPSQLKQALEDIKPQIDSIINEVGTITNDVNEILNEGKEIIDNPVGYALDKHEDKAKENIRKYGESKGLIYDKNGKVIGKRYE